jgi:hypothetical protein
VDELVPAQPEDERRDEHEHAGQGKTHLLPTQPFINTDP